MKTYLKIALLSSITVLASCGDTPEEEAAKLAALNTCPATQTLTDISSYSTEIADPSLEQAKWFEENGKMEGVVTTPSGLQYKVNKSGNAKGPNPLPTQTVRINYHGTFLNGSKFDSSYDGDPIKYPLNGFIKGWIEGVGLMKPCDAWTLYIPSDLAYGPNGKGPIPPATPLIFHVQLLEVIK